MRGLGGGGAWDDSCLPTRLEVSGYFDSFVDSLPLSTGPDWTTENTLPVYWEDWSLPTVAFWFYFQIEKQPKVKIQTWTLIPGRSECESQRRLSLAGCLRINLLLSLNLGVFTCNIGITIRFTPQGRYGD